MINRSVLRGIVDRAERGPHLPGEAQLLRDAVDLLDDLAGAVDKIIARADGERPIDHEGYDVTTTAQMRVVGWGDRVDDDRHYG